MKYIYFLITIFVVNITFAQIPTGYYNSATSTGFSLKTQLKNIIDNNNDGLSPEFFAQDLGYAALYVTFQNSDVDLYFENNGTLLDMYSERVIQNPDNSSTNLPDSYEYTYGINQDDGTLGTVEGQRYNREHTIPQNSFSSGSPMRNDAHFVIPTDKYINGQRGNLPYGLVNTSNSNNEYSNGTLRGDNENSGVSAGYSGDVFEPIDEFKGDIARMFFFFVTRYEDQMTGFNYVMFDGSSNQAIDQPFLNILYNWHINDPVSQREIDRNNAIFDRQSNRNPYIDNPQFVLDIWQSVLSVEEFGIVDAFKMYPNPVDNVLHIELQSAKQTQVEIYNVIGKLVISKTINNSETIQTESLSDGMYIIRLTQGNTTISKKLIKN